jgi:dihydroflavonol-4-reductase
MRAFLTGGTGFIGKRVVQRLLERGYDVTCLVRSPDKAVDLCEMGAAIVRGDITDRQTLREGMFGADVVFHIVGRFEVGLHPSAQARLEQLHVCGTENVLGLAVELGVPKIVYTSTLAVLGGTRGLVVDETYERDSPFDSACDRTKYQAHRIAERYVAQGAPIIIVMPAEVYGPGEHSVIGAFLVLQLRRLLLVMPGADTGFSLVHVDDVAEGHILAAEKGQVGQSYILGGDVMTAGDAFQVTSRLAGVPVPLLFLNSGRVASLRPLADWLERFVTLPPLLSSELLRSLGRTWWATSAKAERELGYTHRAIEEGMAETVLWETARLRDQPSFGQSKTLLALAAVPFFLGLALLWRRRRCA